MKGINNYNETQVITERKKLPAGAYEVEILRAEERNNALCFVFDIADGDYKGYFMDKYNNDRKNYPDDAKYKGVYRLWYESEDNDEKRNERNRRILKTELEKVKESNKLSIDFSKEWDGAALKGCRVGMVFRDEEYSINGYQGYSARPYGFVTLADFKEGKFTIPTPKKRNNSTMDAQPVPLDNDLPF